MALNDNTNGGAWGGDWSAWIIIFLIFAMFGGFGRGWGNNGGGVQDNYVLTSDFAQVERKLDSITNGLCDGFYTQAQLINGTNTNLMQGFNQLGTQIAGCCCDIREGIAGVNYNMAMNTNALSREVERGFCDTNYNMANQHCQTMQAIDKVGDRIVDYLNADKLATLRDENQALRLAASQAAQNTYLVNQLRPAPIPAFNVPAPWNYGTSCGCA